MKLHIGCGNTILNGWVNVDYQEGEDVDHVVDLDHSTLPFDDDSVSDIYGSHVFEHLSNPLHAMNELYRVAEPGAELVLAVPYGSSDDAWEDPTLVRPYFIGSWAPFGQPYHWRSNGYGYAGDWQATDITLDMPDTLTKVPPEQLMQLIQTGRNVVQQMIVTMSAVKPARPRDRALLSNPPLTFRAV